MKNVVVIGGGTGLSAMMSGLKHLQDVQLTAIITVADDGGSTGRIRDTYNTPAMGDIRHVLCAMAEEDNDSLFVDLMNFRFSGSRDIGGHQLGNLIFLALMEITGSFMGAVSAISRVLKVKGNILPSTLDNAILYALMKDGTLVRGEKNIPNTDNSISRVFYEDDIRAYGKAIKAIEQADLIIYGIGSLYTSILPNLIIRDIAGAIAQSPVKKVYFCNAMTQPGETDGYSAEDHVRALEKHTYKNSVDLLVINKSPIDESALARYARQSSYPVTLQEADHTYQIMEEELSVVDENGRIRHDSDAIARTVEKILHGIEEEGDNVVFK
ncbi:gluconeogenesis factor YvcK family protein [Allobaculum mucilyticum]|uniref:gluconeogenesis factor YvcK family protein n=1 Tax=Allobaculum mucilyticum TaxID=2834459 RepID=UPI001E4D014E|nr:gluconeogenesis factor YvcK family protein [Allobaculum mucilyticum]UNT96835.1 YvcK family protein [Allobaculum mucilyticum]